MENRKEYIKQAEIKVKSLLADLYEEDSKTLAKISAIRANYKKELKELEERESELTEQRLELEKNFKAVKETDSKNWQDVKIEFEITLSFVEGDRDGFINKAEALIEEIGNKIKDLEEKTLDAVGEVKINLQNNIEKLNISRNELSEKINHVKANSNEKWEDIKHWFLERKESIKELFSISETN